MKIHTLRGDFQQEFGLLAWFWVMLWIPSSLVAQDLNPSQVFAKVRASIVVVKSLDERGATISLGSGIKLPSGRIVTNFHVVKEGARFLVGKSSHFVTATIFAADGVKDLCLLDAPNLKAPGIILGRTTSLKVGAPVYAVGSPQGLELSLSNGIVSQLRGGSPPIIQTTAAISPGSSGGGLFDSSGHLVGITSFYVEGGQSLNFALPVEWIEGLKAGKVQEVVTHSSGDWLAVAIKLERQGDWPEMLDWTRKWVEASAEDANAWFCLGNAYVNLHRPNDAIDAFRQVLRINPEDAEAWDNLGNACSDLNRLSEAIEAHRNALRINPEFVGAWYNLGNSYRYINRQNDAIESYRQALRIDPKFFQAWCGLGMSYGLAFRHSDALDAFRQALRINPEYADAWYGLSITYSQLGNKEAALDAIRELRKRDPARADQLFDIMVPK